MQTVQFTIPTWAPQILVVAGLTLLFGLLTGLIVQYIKHKYTLAQGQSLAMLAVHNALIVVSLAFTALSYFLPFLQQNIIAFQHLPYVGAYAVGLYGAANYLYALKGRTWFNNILQTAQKLDAKNNAPAKPVSPTVAKLASLPELTAPTQSRQVAQSSDPAASDFPSA